MGVAMGITDRIERRLKLHDLRVLMSVVQAGSMSKAAERLGTAQPALSRSIAELEHALGVRLLDRSPRGVEATDYGRALIKRGIAVFDALRQARGTRGRVDGEFNLPNWSTSHGCFCRSIRLPARLSRQAFARAE